jgi:hypothetical protein
MEVILNSILMMCLNRNLVCEKQHERYTLKYYQTGKACYIEGVFYESCPKREYK